MTYSAIILFSNILIQAGDRLALERKLGRSLFAEEMGAGFTAGVRFYFKYDELEKHPRMVHNMNRRSMENVLNAKYEKLPTPKK